MPLLFVHGVNVRRGPVYDRETAFRNRNFIDIFYRELGLTIPESSLLNPYWGDLGSDLSDDSPYLPRGTYPMLWAKRHHDTVELIESHADTLPVENESVYDDEDETPLLTLARTASLNHAVDFLCDLTMKDLPEGSDSTALAESAAFLATLSREADTWSQNTEVGSWLKKMKSDEDLIAGLEKLVTKANDSKSSRTKINLTSVFDSVKSAGKRFRDRIHDTRMNMRSKAKELHFQTKEAVSQTRHKIRKTAVGAASLAVSNPLRLAFHKNLATLVGDSVEYFSKRGDENHPSPITSRIIEAMREGVEIKQRTGEDFIVVGHSMGGIIVTDIVTCYGKDIPIDYLITVGSQFSLFMDLKLFPGIQGDLPANKPTTVKHWINIFDPNDIMGYPASHAFNDVQDYHLPTYAMGGAAHMDYFNRRSFYAQLARRIQASYLTPAQAGKH